MIVTLDTQTATTWLKIEFSFYDDSDQNARILYWLDQAQANMNGSDWLQQYTRAAMLWAAHHMIVQDIIEAALVDPDSGSAAGIEFAGATVERKARDLAVRYGTSFWNSASADAGMSAGDAYWRLTIAGLEYLRIRETRPGRYPRNFGARSGGPGFCGPFGPFVRIP